MRGPSPSGSTSALAEFHCDSGMPIADSHDSHESWPSGGGLSTYPSASAQKRESAAGSAQSMATCTVLAMATSLVGEGRRLQQALGIGHRHRHAGVAQP